VHFVKAQTGTAVKCYEYAISYDIEISDNIVRMHGSFDTTTITQVTSTNFRLATSPI